jgi:hypothetical protein
LKNSKLIDKEFEYIKKHILLEQINIINTKDDKLDTKNNQNNQN